MPQLSLKLDETLLLKLNTDNNKNIWWWQILENCQHKFYERIHLKLPKINRKKHLVFYIFSNKLIPFQINWLTAGG